MKSMILAIAFFSSFLNAQTQSLKVVNFNFNYRNPSGEGNAAFFSMSKIQSDQSLQVQVERLDRDFHFSVSGSENQEYLFKNAPDLLVESESVSIKGLNLNLSDKLVFNLTSGSFLSKDDEFNLENLSLDCARDLSQSEVTDQLISGCTQRLSLKAGKFSSQEVIMGILNSVINDDHHGMSDKGKVGVNSLDLRINAGKFDLSGDVKADISGKVKSYGTISYNSSTGLLMLKISEVKFSILNVTGKVFEELKKNENEKMKVRQPYVYISLK